MVAVRFCNSGVTCWSLFFSGCLRAWDVVNPGWSLWGLGQRCPDAGPVLAGWPLNAAMVRKNLANVGTMLVQRLRRWANILPTLVISYVILIVSSGFCPWASTRHHYYNIVVADDAASLGGLWNWKPRQGGTRVNWSSERKKSDPVDISLHALANYDIIIASSPVKTKDVHSICTVLHQRRNFGPALYKCYTNVLCLLGVM